MDFTWSPYWIFLRGLNHNFGQKLEKFSSQFDFGQISLEIMFADHPVRKQTFLDEKTHRFYTEDILGFLKGLTHDFGQKLEKFHFSLILDK